MRHLKNLLNTLILPFILGLVFFNLITCAAYIFSPTLLTGNIDQNLLPKALHNDQKRPISDLIPFALLFVPYFHLYVFGRKNKLLKNYFLQFTGGALSYILLTSLLPDLLSLFVCLLFPFVYVYVSDKKRGFFIDPIGILCSPVIVIAWLPGALFGFGLLHGFLISMLYSLLIIGVPSTIFCISFLFCPCFFQEED